MTIKVSIPNKNKFAGWMDIATILLAAIILGAPSLIYPFGRDQGEYAWIAASAMSGKIIYRDVFNVKPPLTHLVHEIALLTFGYRMASIRIFDLLWQGITSVLIYKVAINIKQPRPIGIFAAVVYLLLYYQKNYWDTAQTDGFLSLPVTAGILLFLKAQQNKHFWLYASSGMAISLGVLFKYPIGILIVFLAFLTLYQYKGRAVFFILWMGIGFWIPLATSAIIMALQGSLTDFLWIQFTYIPKYSAISPEGRPYLDSIILGFVSILKTPVPGWISIFGLCNLFSFWKYRRSQLAPISTIVMWWISAVIHLIIQNKFYSYHFLPIFAPLALMTSGFFVDIKKIRGIISFAFGCLGVSLIVFPIIFNLHNFSQNYIHLYDVISGNVTSQAVYRYTIFSDGKDFSSRADLETAQYLGNHTNPNERIFIWGFEPGVYFLAQRMNTTRFIYNFPLYGPNANPELQREFLDEIRAQKPVYIVFVKNDSIFHVTGSERDSWTEFNYFTEFHNFVAESYQFEISIEDFMLYHLKP